jgi:amidohydrolase
MIEEGVLENPQPDVFLSAHVWNERPVGSIDVAPGPVMAASDEWKCVIRGRGGHGALPHRAADPIVAAAQVITALQTVVSRDVSPLDTAVVSVGSIHGGDAFNIIPSTVELTGTIRTFAPSIRDLVLQRMREVVEGVAAACDTSAELEILPLTPALINDAQVAEMVRRAAETVVGVENVTSNQRTMGSEDAAFFLEEVPGCYFFLGTANAEKDLIVTHHNPRFDIDEEAMVFGVAILAQATALYLSVEP